MSAAIQELKVRATLLHKRLQEDDARALRRLRVLPTYRRAADADLRALAPTLQHRHCLAVIAGELGFANWPEASRVLTGDGPIENFGDLLCQPSTATHLNHWFARYEEAAALREQQQGYLLAYRRHFLVVDRYYIKALGLDPDDPDWAALGFDWARPQRVAARTRLYDKLIAGLPRAEV